ncbi:D-alanyl-lipoteichoic acid biosynthesis protein DltD [Adlercreutzia shanghongiae]|uniref:D-alanyl-lipoteichoic acid biosynthesis protein DltD n=1 Tax=Adlercreutzia shanghongiae TaxID=3111773 RepID=A0ABU6J0N0_9ACTN|nr:D-alanyl-lipoteichoic acid biosynthesis protein DltD [Adlercreutzia sp. R22]MEC4295528.1 D-alanyl-lipoteichoic acid biosynthesis protein DltD [Adlercreutzia sp. R22]
MEKLIGVGLALALSAGLGGAWYVQAPTEHALESKAQEHPILPRVQDAVASSPSLIADMIATRATYGDDVRILLGTSELEQTTQDTAHPVRFFSENDCGFSLMCVGNAGCQSLWQAMEVAALDYEGALPGRKIALMLGTQWFMGDGLSESAFAEKFSEETFASVMQNDRLSDETKEKIYQRCLAMGADQATLDALRGTSLTDSINRAVTEAISSTEHRENIATELDAEALPYNPELLQKTTPPSWDELDAAVLADAEAMCTNNDLGIYDEYYTEYFVKWDEKNHAENKPRATEWNQDEFADFDIFLSVCKDLGIEPLVVIQPAMGVYYDNTPWDKESRQIFYDQIHDVLDTADIEYVDLSVHDYDKYYMKDVMHPGWKSWVEVDKKLCEFYGDGR